MKWRMLLTYKERKSLVPKDIAAYLVAIMAWHIIIPATYVPSAGLVNFVAPTAAFLFSGAVLIAGARYVRQAQLQPESLTRTAIIVIPLSCVVVALAGIIQMIIRYLVIGRGVF